MSIKEKLVYVSEAMHEKIKNVFGATLIPTEDYGWENFRYHSPVFRQAHVERYFQDGLMVVHVTCIPHADDPSPIFGFDIVASEKTGKISGAFLDWSPVLYDASWHNSEWNGERILPEWATVFSNQFIAIRPENDDILDFAIKSFDEYLHMLCDAQPVDTDAARKVIIEKQNEYCEKQSQNPRTFAALKHKIGEEKARFFMQNVLFPKLL